MDVVWTHAAHTHARHLPRGNCAHRLSPNTYPSGSITATGALCLPRFAGTRPCARRIRRLKNFGTATHARLAPRPPPAPSTHPPTAHYHPGLNPHHPTSCRRPAWQTRDCYNQHWRTAQHLRAHSISHKQTSTPPSRFILMPCCTHTQACLLWINGTFYYNARMSTPACCTRFRGEKVGWTMQYAGTAADGGRPAIL